MSIRVSPTEPQLTHHFKLNDRKGVTLGLTACDANGKTINFYDESLYVKNPVFTTAFKQTSGSGGYDIFDYPYFPVVQDDLSGGRGNLDFERDSTKYYDSYRCASSRANKAYAGPLENYATGGHRGAIQSMPGSVDYVQLTGTTRYIYKRFQATGITTSKIWLKLRRRGLPGNLTVKLYSDNAGALNAELTSLTIPYTWMNDTLSEWVNDTLATSSSNGAYYWIVVYGDANDNDKKYWKIAVKESVGTTYATASFDTTPDVASFDLYYRLTDADTEKTCIDFEYKEQQYFVVSGASGAPKIYMAGDRGAADSNAGQLSKLIDASKTWTVNEHVGSVVLITDGPGKLEPQPWRTITANGTGDLTPDTAWTIEHTTTTEYVILSPKLKEITGHGLTAPVTDVLVSPTGVIYFCMGDSTVVRRLRAFNDAGVWKDFDNAASCQADESATTKAVFMVYKPQNQKIVIANNSDASGNVSVNTNTNSAPNIPVWGTALTFGTAVPIDSKYRRINGLVVHPDPGGNEAVWVLKIDMPFVYPSSGNPYPAGPEEFKTVRSLYNGVRPLKHDVYLYFPLLQGLQRYYGGTYSSVGPDIGEGLPSNRRGAIVDSLGYPGKFFVAIDAGASGYSSVMDSGGYHERYRAPKGQRIKTLAFQVIPGSSLDRLWIFQGNDFVWLPFPSDSTNELEDTSYTYVDEFAVESSRKHAGMYDVQKMIKFLKLQTDQLEVNADNGKAICYFELDYKLDDADEWLTLDDPFTVSPNQTVDFSSVYGIAGKRIKWRLRGYTRDASKTPVFLAIIIFAVMRVDVKKIYGPFHFLCEDNEKIGLREDDKQVSAKEKLEILEAWGDASNDSLLKLNSASVMCDDKMIFINVGTSKQIRFQKPDGNEHLGNAFLVDVTFQDA